MRADDHRRSAWPTYGTLIAVAACLMLSMLTIAVQFTPHGYLSNEDSWGPMRAALGLRGTPALDRLYETLFFEQHVKLQYPPTSLLPLEALDAWGLASSHALNALNAGLFLVNAALMALLAAALFPSDGTRRIAGRPVVIALGAASALAFYPITRGLQLGQIQIWLDLAFTAACLLLARGRTGPAGAVMGFASLIKPQFLPLLLFAAMLRQWRFIAGFAAVAAALGLFSLWRYGLHNHLEYAAVLSFIGRHGEAFYSNNSVNGIANRLLGNGSNLAWTGDSFPPFHPVVFAASSAAAVLFLAAPLLLRPAAEDCPGVLLHFCLATLCLVMASPVAWEHHYGIMPPMFLVVAAHLAGMPAGARRARRGILVALAWLLCASKLDPVVNRLSETALNPLQATQFLGAALLLLVLSGLLRDRRVMRGPAAASSSLGPGVGITMIAVSAE